MLRLNNWITRLALSNLRDGLTKSIILFLSSLVSFTSLLLAVGFYVGSQQTLDQTQNNLIDSELFQITKKEYISNSSSPILLVKMTRPNKDELIFLSSHLPSAIMGNNYEGIFPGNYHLRYKTAEIDNVSLTPIYSFSSLLQKNELLIAGDVPNQESINAVVINESFAKQIAIKNQEIIDQYVDIVIESEISIIDQFGNKVKDTFYYAGTFKIHAVYRELSFLNSPKIFYSYCALENMLADYELENISENLNTRVDGQNIYDLIDNNHPLSLYSYNLFVINNQEIDAASKLAQLLDDSDSSLFLSSNSLLIRDTYRQLTDATFYSMIIFVVIALVGTCSILAIGAFSNYVSKKKESAILTCLGASKNSILRIFFTQTLFVIGLSLCLSFFFAYFGEILINKTLFYLFSFNNLINIPFIRIGNIPFAIEAIVMLSGYIISFLFTCLPLAIYKGFSLADELRES